MRGRVSVLDHLQHVYPQHHWMVFSIPGTDMAKGRRTPARLTLGPWPWQEQRGRGGEVGGDDGGRWQMQG